MSTLLKKLARRFFRGEKSELRQICASHAAFYVVVSSIPMLLLILQLLCRISPDGAEELAQRLLAGVPGYVAGALPRELIISATSASVPLISVSALTLLWSSAKGVIAISSGVRAVYGGNRPEMPFRRYVKALVFTVYFLLITVFALWVLVLGPGISAALTRAHSIYVDLSTVITRLGWLFALGFFTLSFSLTYRFFSERPLPFRAHLPGALFSGVGWLGLSGALSLYLRVFRPYNLYGGLGALLLLMLWVRLCMSVLLFGAQINVFFAKRPLLVSLPK